MASGSYLQSFSPPGYINEEHNEVIWIFTELCLLINILPDAVRHDRT